MKAFETVNATKIIRGKTILDHISLSADEGDSIAIMGKNGSGKSMFLKTLCGLIRINEGEITVFGTRVGKSGAYAPHTGCLIERPGFIEEYSALRNLVLLSRIQRKIGGAEILKIMNDFGLDPNDRRAVNKYSLGMRQRLGLAQAVMERPKLLVLDEPGNNLDEETIEEMRGKLKALKARGVTLIVTMHNPIEARTLCSRICRIDNGRLTECEV